MILPINRWIENGLTDVLDRERIGCIAFGSLEGGVLSNKYLHGIPADSRVRHDPRYLKPENIKPQSEQANRNR